MRLFLSFAIFLWASVIQTASSQTLTTIQGPIQGSPSISALLEDCLSPVDWNDIVFYSAVPIAAGFGLFLLLAFLQDIRQAHKSNRSCPPASRTIRGNRARKERTYVIDVEYAGCSYWASFLRCCGVHKSSAANKNQQQMRLKGTIGFSDWLSFDLILGSRSEQKIVTTPRSIGKLVAVEMMYPSMSAGLNCRQLPSTNIGACLHRLINTAYDIEIKNIEVTDTKTQDHFIIGYEASKGPLSYTEQGIIIVLRLLLSNIQPSSRVKYAAYYFKHGSLWTSTFMPWCEGNFTGTRHITCLFACISYTMVAMQLISQPFLRPSIEEIVLVIPLGIDITMGMVIKAVGVGAVLFPFFILLEILGRATPTIWSLFAHQPDQCITNDQEGDQQENPESTSHQDQKSNDTECSCEICVTVSNPPVDTVDDVDIENTSVTYHHCSPNNGHGIFNLSSLIDYKPTVRSSGGLTHSSSSVSLDSEDSTLTNVTPLSNISWSTSSDFLSTCDLSEFSSISDLSSSCISSAQLLDKTASDESQGVTETSSHNDNNLLPSVSGMSNNQHRMIDKQEAGDGWQTTKYHDEQCVMEQEDTDATMGFKRYSTALNDTTISCFNGMGKGRVMSMPILPTPGTTSQNKMENIKKTTSSDFIIDMPVEFVKPNETIQRSVSHESFFYKVTKWLDGLNSKLQGDVSDDAMKTLDKNTCLSSILEGDEAKMSEDDVISLVSSSNRSSISSDQVTAKRQLSDGYDTNENNNNEVTIIDMEQCYEPSTSMPVISTDSDSVLSIDTSVWSSSTSTICQVDTSVRANINYSTETKHNDHGYVEENTTKHHPGCFLPILAAFGHILLIASCILALMWSVSNVHGMCWTAFWEWVATCIIAILTHAVILDTIKAIIMTFVKVQLDKKLS